MSLLDMSSGNDRRDSPSGRIAAMVMRYWYLLRGSWPRIVETLYWPTLNVCLWGLISRFFQGNSSYVAEGAGVLIGAVLLWEVLFRGQIGMSMCFLEEMWSRNLGHLFVSPLRPLEWLAAMMIASFMRIIVGLLPAALIAIALYHYSIFDLGLPLLAFFTALMLMGWAISLVVIALILSYGMSAESLAWMGMFALAPLCAVYYPVASMPGWLQPIANTVPATHVFEGMRGVLFNHHFDPIQFADAMGLDVIYFLVGSACFAAAFARARNRGSLLNVGE